LAHKEHTSEISNNLAKTHLKFIETSQEPDGNFPPIINPISGHQTQIDWPRSAFSAWALAEFGALVNNENYIKASHKHLYYLKDQLDRKLPLANNVLFLTFAYAGQEALALFKFSKKRDYYFIARTYGEKILENENMLSYNPINHQQIASFFIELSYFDRKFFEPSLKLAEIAKADFENSLKIGNTLNLAVYAELVNLFNKIFKFTEDKQYKEFSTKVTKWLISHQLSQGPNGELGPFSESTTSNFVYARGTGKVFEVLAGLPEYQFEARKALAWLLIMQYNGENTFFVRPEILPKTIGGFRHDYFNHEAWIDSAGHFLLGGSRLLSL